jgi:hypothetical protein
MHPAGTLNRGDTAENFFSTLNHLHQEQRAEGAARSVPGRSGFHFTDLRKVFKSRPEYCFASFFEAAMLYSDIHPSLYQKACSHVAADVRLYPEWLRLLRGLSAPAEASTGRSKVHALVVTSGIREVWKAALSKHGLLGKGGNVTLIAGNRLHGQHIAIDAGHGNSSGSTRPYVVGEAEKGKIATWLRAEGARKARRVRVLAFGNSGNDRSMLEAADRAFVVLDAKRNRSLMPLPEVHDSAATCTFEVH